MGLPFALYLLLSQSRLEMQSAQAHLLAGGRRLHLHHGPIDLIIEAFGRGRENAYQLATKRFQTVLEELVAELPALRQPADNSRAFTGPVANRMHLGVIPFLPTFITPMAAVAGAVADEILSVMAKVPDLSKIYVNNGGDTAFYLTPGEQISAVIAAPKAGKINVRWEDPCRGIATSGWRGRSHSFGIADAVCIVAANAATADAAATLIANAVDLPDHPEIKRLPAHELLPDSDLKDRLVTTDVGVLSSLDCVEALDKGEEYSNLLLNRNIISGALLMLNNQQRAVGASSFISQANGDLTHA